MTAEHRAGAVVATAGHVDHGKSALVRALTGQEPDRHLEERRRGLTIDLGFVWTTLDDGTPLAFVDVPGHERFITTALGGVGPAPAVLLVVAADGGWMPQTGEHVAALDALGVRDGVLAITRSDLADPRPATEDAVRRLAATTLAGLPAVAVSARTGDGLDELRAVLADLVRRTPGSDPDAPVRLWVDRAFSVRGAGTVVTGTLPAGTIRAGDALRIESGGLGRGTEVAVRGLQALEQPYDAVRGPARAALNLRGAAVADVPRGTALVSPGAWTTTDLVDVRCCRAADETDGSGGGRVLTVRLPREVQVHVGAAAVAARVCPLGDPASGLVRLRLRRALPLHVGDRLVLRDPGDRSVQGATVLDVRPPALRRRGAAAARARELAVTDGRPDLDDELRRRRVVRAGDVQAMGVAVPTTDPRATSTGHLVDPATRGELAARLRTAVEAYAAAAPLEPGLPLEAARRALDLPDRDLVAALVEPPLVVRDGRVARAAAAAALPADVRAAVDRLLAELTAAPYAAADAERRRALGLGPRELAAAARAGVLLRISDDVWLAPDADAAAALRLAALPQPFTVAQARDALGTSRRVVVPLLEHLDAHRLTRRTSDTLREVRPHGDSA